MAAAKKRKKKDQNTLYNERLQLRMIILLVIFLTIIASLKLGIVGININYLFEYFFGNFTGIIYGIILIVASYYFMKLDIPKYTSPEAVGIYLILIALITLASFPSDHSIKGMDVINLFFSQSNIIRGGLIGSLLYGCFSMLFDYVGTIIACSLLLIVGLFLLLGRHYIKHQKKIEQFKKKQIQHYRQLNQMQQQKEKQDNRFFLIKYLMI